MKYPYKYPRLYGELAMQGKSKRELAHAIHITMLELKYKQSVETDGDFDGQEMKEAAKLLEKSIDYLFNMEVED